jgi:hypothetical protein
VAGGTNKNQFACRQGAVDTFVLGVPH